MVPRVSVVVVNYRAGDWLRACLQALRQQTYSHFELILWDNASGDGSVEAALAAVGDGWLRVVRHPVNIGFAAGNNRAAHMARGQWIVLLNPDAVPAPDWLERLVAAAERHPEAFLGSLQLDATDPGLVDGAGDHYLACGIAWRSGHGRNRPASLPAEAEIFGPCAAAALYPVQRFLALGGFDEDYFCYFEDVDLAFRHRLQGGECFQINKAVVHHAGGACSGAKRSPFSTRFGIRNMVLTFVKNMPAPLLWPLLFGHVAAVAAMTLQSVLRGHGGAAVSGLMAALAMLPRTIAKRRKRTVGLGALAAAMVWNPCLWAKRGGNGWPG